MVNETFWFFYFVEVCERLGGGGSFLLFVFGVLLAGFGFAAYVDDDLPNFKTRVPGIIGAFMIFLGLAFGAFMPPKEAFYGGATQYVAEVTEVDKTLLQLKEMIDKKIEEEINETEE